MPAVIILSNETLPKIKERLSGINADTKPAWGKFDPPHLMAHLVRNIEIGLAEIEVADDSKPIVRGFMKWFAFHSGFPWPKGKLPAPPIFLPEPQGDFESERNRLYDALDRFVAAANKEPGRITVNPIIGPLTLDYWRRTIGMHFDHHLTQFGV